MRRDSPELADDVWVATTTDATDDVLAAHLDELGVPYVRGSLDDVLARYVQAAEARGATRYRAHHVRLSAHRPECIDEMIPRFRERPRRLRQQTATHVPHRNGHRGVLASGA